MKQNNFLWAWGDYALSDDPLMTRERAARLLIAWRHTSRQKRNGGPMRQLTRTGPHTYHVRQLNCNEHCTLKVVYPCISSES